MAKDYLGGVRQRLIDPSAFNVPLRDESGRVSEMFGITHHSPGVRI